MRIQRLDVGVERISRWQVDDEQHLPKESKLAPKFLPRNQELDEILKRPSLDERLPRMLEPEYIDPDLLEPSVLTDARRGAHNVFAEAAARARGARKETLSAAADVLDQEVQFDHDIRTALAALFKG